MNMSKNIDHHLANYSKINFDNDLKNLEKDVKDRLNASWSAPSEAKNFIETWFGVPISLGLSAVASMMVLGFILGTQLQTETHSVQPDMLGLEVFSASNAKLPSSLLAANL